MYAKLIADHHGDLKTRIYSGIVLNNVVGGINPYAVEHMDLLERGCGDLWTWQGDWNFSLPDLAGAECQSIWSSTISLQVSLWNSS